MSNTGFDAEGFFAALNLTREAKRISWKEVANQTGVSASTLTRMGQGKRPDVDTLASLALWAAIDVRDFYVDDTKKKRSPETLAQISALLRADKNLDGQAAKMLESMLESAYKTMRKGRG
ncbi:MAG: helix-turn-helix domain-containing protein [Hyphomonadaceae bacterium]